MGGGRFKWRMFSCSPRILFHLLFFFCSIKCFEPRTGICSCRSTSGARSVALLQSYVIDSAIVSDDACTFTWNIMETMMYGRKIRNDSPVRASVVQRAFSSSATRRNIIFVKSCATEVSSIISAKYYFSSTFGLTMRCGLRLQTQNNTMIRQ